MKGMRVFKNILFISNKVQEENATIIDIYIVYIIMNIK